VGLAHGSVVFWFVALGPALFVLIVRVLVALFSWGDRRTGRPEDAPPPPPSGPGKGPDSWVTRPPQIAKATPESLITPGGRPRRGAARRAE
jgi:hypothetical protein